MRFLWVCTLMCAVPAMAAPLEFPRATGTVTVNTSASPYYPAAKTTERICDSVVKSAREAYESEDFANGLIRSDPFRAPGLVPLAFSSLVELENEPGHWGRRRYLLAMKEQKLFVTYQVHPGCGGGCERASLEFRAAPESSETNTEALYGWQLYTDDVRWYAVGSSRETMSVFRLDGAAPREVCHIDIEVPAPAESQDPDIQAVLPAIEAFDKAIDGVVRGSGSCGSLQSAGRLGQESRLASRTLVYRPWALIGAVPIEELEAWSLQGISEFEALNSLKRQFVQTRDALAAFYLKKGYVKDAAAANTLATQAVSGATAYSFWFGEDSRLGTSGLQLRRALLEHRPMNAIRAIEFAPAEVDAASRRENDGAFGHNFADSLLATAVRYPEALEYLLDRGINPNGANEFGKTPLMFAAQYDEIRAVEILLAHGADPNALTTPPFDGCYYILQWSHATPLHYAARYSSPGLIEKLIAGGALTFIEGTPAERYGPSKGFPLDWFRLRRETAAKDAQAYERLLALPDVAERERVARSLAAKAAAEYRAKRVQPAYQMLRNALSVLPEDVPALADFSLIAMRAGQPGESLQASAQVRRMTQDPALVANAWFNTGLVCSARRGMSFYNGRYYCQASELHPYLMSWRAQASPAREKKITEVFDSSHARWCAVTSKGVRREYWFALSTETLEPPTTQLNRIYVRHPLNAPPPANAVVVKLPAVSRSPEPRTFVSRPVETYAFSTFAVTVLTIDVYPQRGTIVETTICDPGEQKLPPQPGQPSKYQLFEPGTLKF